MSLTVQPSSGQRTGHLSHAWNTPGKSNTALGELGELGVSGATPASLVAGRHRSERVSCCLHAAVLDGNISSVSLGSRRPWRGAECRGPRLGQRCLPGPAGPGCGEGLGLPALRLRQVPAPNAKNNRASRAALTCHTSRSPYRQVF